VRSDSVSGCYQEENKPFTGLTVSADIPAATDLLGKSVTDLQSSVTVGDGAITGTLNYVTGYTGFSGDASQQSGNYIALKISSADASRLAIIFGTTGEKELDADGIAVLRVTDKATQRVGVKVTRGGATGTVEYSLTGLTLAEEGD